MLHKNLVLTERHPPHSYEYVNASARTSATGFTSSDIGKLAWQQDNDTFWVLTSATPTWVTFGSSGTWGGISGTLSDQSDLNSALAGKSNTAHNHTGVYEPADATILKDADIGVSIAAQGHNHAGVYEPADPTILKDADVGVNVAAQAHSHDHGGLSGLGDDDHGQYALTNPTHSAITYTAGGTSTVSLDGRKEVFSSTASGGATTWSFTGSASSGTVSSFILELTNGGSQTQNWPLSVKWDAGVAPTLTSSGLDILAFYTRDAGTTWRGFLAAADSK